MATVLGLFLLAKWVDLANEEMFVRFSAPAPLR
jgi:hypothetical protein